MENARASLLEAFAELTAPRTRECEHKLEELLLVAIGAVISGAANQGSSYDCPRTSPDTQDKKSHYHFRQSSCFPPSRSSLVQRIIDRLILESIGFASVDKRLHALLANSVISLTLKVSKVREVVQIRPWKNPARVTVAKYQLHCVSSYRSDIDDSYVIGNGQGFTCASAHHLALCALAVFTKKGMT